MSVKFEPDPTHIQANAVKRSRNSTGSTVRRDFPPGFDYRIPQESNQGAYRVPGRGIELPKSYLPIVIVAFSFISGEVIEF